LELEPIPSQTYSLKGNPAFERSQLPPEMRRWYDRFWSTVEDPKLDYPPLNPTSLAQSGDLYQLGRNLNVYVTSMLNMLRVTGDLALLDEIDHLMGLVQGTLRDTNGDGFRNFRYLRTAGGSKFYGDDRHEMDEVLTHSFLAAVAYAFKENAQYSDRYAEQAAFWTDYLKNDFEAKWRARNDEPSGFPFLTFDLTHPYVQWIRYHYYMAKLTGEGGYYREAERMAELVAEHMREVYTPNGPAFVWDHRFLPDTDNGPLGCQPFIYVQYTIQGFQDLYLEGFSVFADDRFLQKAATAISEFIIDNGSHSFAQDICSGTYQRGLRPNTGDRGVVSLFLNYPFAALGKWDATGETEEITREVYRRLEDDPDAPHHYNLPAMMVFMLAGERPDTAQASTQP